MLRNPAYMGRACFGKTEARPRQRITRPLRQRNGIVSRNSVKSDRPRQDWIEIAVPPLISEETFALAQEQLEKTNGFRCGAQSSQPCCRGYWFASVAVMRSIEPQLGAP